MNKHKYILEPYKGMNTRYRCEHCQHKDKKFSRYIDTETGEHIHPTVGRCNRKIKCGYHYTPKQYFQDNNISFDTPKAYKSRPVTPQPKPVSFISVEVFKASLKAYETNHLVKYIIELFGVEIANQLVSRYLIGTSKHWNGSTIFWQIDTQGKVRTGKIMLYTPTTGKRVKEPFNHIYWEHKALKQPEFELKQCLFGEHLLIYKTKPVAIVESEKTAVIASVYFPQFIWLAFGGIGFNIDKCSILKGRTVTLFPDCSKPKEGKPTAFEQWSNKAKELSHLAYFKISDLLERKATEAERKLGYDLADYLVKFDYKLFNLSKPTSSKVKQTEVENSLPLEVISYSQKPESWEQEITELENYFAGITLPTQPVKYKQGETITNCSLFIESHFATVKKNNGKRIFLPHLHRLQKLKQVVESKIVT